MTVTNATFVIERQLDAPPSRVFTAYTSLAAKSAWFKTPSDVEVLDRDFDFRIGGQERFRARWASGLITDFQATYRDIVENERIVLVYDLFHGEEKLSVSLQTIELRAEGHGTRLFHTEQGSYFSGGQDAVDGREHGTSQTRLSWLPIRRGSQLAFQISVFSARASASSTSMPR